MHCTVCGRDMKFDPLRHVCPKSTRRRLDEEDRKADLEAEIQDDDLDEYRFRFLESDGEDG